MEGKHIGIAALVLIMFGLLWGCATYNGFVHKNQAVDAAWGDLRSAYQRRADLVPNIVETVKAERDFEKEVLIKVTEARARAGSITLTAEDLADSTKVEQFKKAQAELSAGLGRLLAVSENYPQLKANQAFHELRTTLEGSENRINVERKDYNAAVADYNSAIKSFPGSLLAGSFTPRKMFEADPGAERAPTVKF